MPQAVTTPPATKFARVVVDAMNERNLSLNDFSLLTANPKKFKRRLNYELLRKIIQGKIHPSPWVMEIICKVLDLDMEHMEKLAVEDKVKAKYGTTVRQIVGADPSITPFENVIPALTPKQRESFLAQMEAVARLNQ